jgi:hypothetical protein
MKKTLLLFSFLFFAASLALSAQEVAPNDELLPDGEFAGKQEFTVWKEMPWSLGANYEMGMNTRNPEENFASGFGVSVDRYLFTPFAMLGILVNFHSDSDEVTATEMLLNFRVNAPLSAGISIFAQFGFGASFYREEERDKSAYTMNFLIGSRFYLMKGPLKGFYIEPYVRTGYPFLFSGGLAAGHWFNF